VNAIPATIAGAARFLSKRVPIVLASPLRLLPWGSTVIGPPRRVVDSSKGSWGEVRRLPSETIASDSIGDLDPGISAIFRRELRDGFVQPHVSLLRNGRVAEPDAAIITESDEVAGDLCRPFGAPPTAHPVFGRLKLARLQRGTGLVGVLHGLRTDNYFHWIFETLGRLAFLRAAGVECPRYFVNAADVVRMQSLAALGISGDRCISPREHPHFQADVLAIPSRLPSGLVPPSVVRFLRSKFAPPDASRGGRRIYVSRQRASRRRMSHGDEILGVLHEFHFETVECEGLTFSQQVELFRDATIVVGPHGAGLANIAFCPEGAAVLECFASDYVNPCYATVASAAGLRYAAIADRPVDPNRRAPHGRSDIALRGDSLRQALRTLVG
jgi:hypothetical protein